METAHIDASVNQACETGFRGSLFAAVRARMQTMGMDSAAVRDYPNPELNSMAPTLPTADAMKRQSVQNLRDLLHRFNAYYRHLEGRHAAAVSDEDDAKEQLSTLSYVVRKSLRGSGYNRDEQKEEVETDPRIIDLKVAAHNYSREAKHLASQVRAAKSAIRAIEEELYWKKNNPPAQHQRLSRRPA